MITNNYESKSKKINVDDKFLEKKKSLLLENKNNKNVIWKPLGNLTLC